MKKAIIIGATSGIGKELAKLLTENGYLVGITGRRTELLNEIQKENPKLYRVRNFDITEIEKIEILNQKAERVQAKKDIQFMKESEEKVKKQIKTNIKTTTVGVTKDVNK